MNTRISTLALFSILLPVTPTATTQAGPLAAWGSHSFGLSKVPAGTFTAIATGNAHSLAIRRDGTLTGWGYNGDGQINVPTGTFTAVVGSFYHSLGIRSDGTLVGWGYGGDGQLNVPAGTFTAIAAGWYHGLAIRSDGTLVGWGYNFSGQTDVPAGIFTAVAGGGGHSLALYSTAIPTLSGWGLSAMTVLVLGAGTVVLARRRVAPGPSVDGSTLAVAATLVLLGVSSSVLAESPLPSQTVELNIDSGLVSATQGTNPVVVFSDVVEVEDAPWIRLHFGDVQLSGSASAGSRELNKKLHPGFCRCKLFRPFRAGLTTAAFIPRALPWAGIWRTFSATVALGWHMAHHSVRGLKSEFSEKTVSTLAELRSELVVKFAAHNPP